VAEDGELIAGHGRVLAATQLGLAEAPVIVLGHLTEALRRAYRLADNKLTELRTWDETLLSAELQELLAEDYDLSLIGFLMIHDPSGLVTGTAADMRDMAAIMDKIAGSMTRDYAARSGKSEEDIAALIAAETWFAAQDALDAGLATRMAEPVRIAASFDIGRFQNAPMALAEGDDAEGAATGATSFQTRTMLHLLPPILCRDCRPRAQRLRTALSPRSMASPSALLQLPTLLRTPAPSVPAVTCIAPTGRTNDRNLQGSPSVKKTLAKTEPSTNDGTLSAYDLLIFFCQPIGTAKRAPFPGNNRRKFNDCGKILEPHRPGCLRGHDEKALGCPVPHQRGIDGGAHTSGPQVLTKLSVFARIFQK
jgi:hypothetical protein